jgi:hypothetical protein
MVTQTRLKEFFDYDAETGNLIWKVRRNSRGGRIKPGEIAGCFGTHGYRLIRVDGQLRGAHRWVWMWHHGELPPPGMDIDHINGDPADNRIENLRLATRSQNLANAAMRSDNKSGAKGVRFDDRRGKWIAYIKADKKHRWLGDHNTLEEAVAARRAASLLLHGEFRREGIR